MLAILWIIWHYNNTFRNNSCLQQFRIEEATENTNIFQQHKTLRVIGIKTHLDLHTNSLSIPSSFW